jgi:ubiquinone/menaquinone biosynthesis C-methylase UbiE
MTVRLDQAYSPLMSSFYDVDWDAIALPRQDAAFYARQASRTRGSICEVGAGTGRVLLQVAEKTQRPCVGIEPSHGMIAHFENRRMEVGRELYELTQVRQGSFTDLPLEDGSQGFVFSAFRSFMHVLTHEEQLQAMAEMKRVLAPDGLLAFDLFEPGPLHMTDGGPYEIYRAETVDGGSLSRFDAHRHNEKNQLLTVDMKWVLRDDGDDLVDTHHCGYTIRYTRRSELFELLEQSGWALMDTYGDFDESPLDDSIRELIVVARPLEDKPR